NSTEELVAGVDDDGKVQVKGHGETAINAIYSNLVATARITSPFADSRAPAAPPKEEAISIIDLFVASKLNELGISPSPTCTDAEFIRRAYLDAAGILPTPEEAQRFLADKSPDKRAKLIDALLERPEFVDYWAYKWSDLFLVSTRKLPQ